jgi:hypothetical protein
MSQQAADDTVDTQGTESTVDVRSDASQAAGKEKSTVDLRSGSKYLERIGHAKANSIIWDIVLRMIMVLVVSGIFIWLNWQVFELVQGALKQDHDMVIAKQLASGDRLITSNVIMALVGATVVQTGIGFIAITSYLFPKRTAEQTETV